MSRQVQGAPGAGRCDDYNLVPQASGAAYRPLLHSVGAVDAKGNAVLPGIVDGHIHPVFGEWTPTQDTIGWIGNYVHGGTTSMVSAGELHLPGAAHLPLAAFFGKGGLLLTGEDLRRVLAGAGINGDRPVLAYCTGGVRSALAWWAIRHGTGYEVLNYDGSWWEWSRRVPAAP